MLINAKKMALVLLLLLLMVVQNHEIVFAQPQSFTAITLSFDDNNLNQYVNAWTLMKQRGMVGTFYVVTDWIVDFHQEWEGKKLNSTHLIDLQDHGNEIGSHSKTHSKFTELTESQIRNECQLSREALESLGLSVNNFAYPHGLSNETIDNLVSEYYRSGRYGGELMNLPVTTFHIHHQAWNWSLGEYKELVDKACSEGKWAVLNFHNVGGNTTGGAWITIEDFTELLDYILSKEVMIITVNQALNILATLFDEYNSVIIEYESLLLEFNDLTSDLEDLKEDQISLNLSFNSLQDSYDSLRVSHDSLTKEHTLLLIRHNELESKYEIKVEDLNTTKNMMLLWFFCLITVTITLSTTTFYFAKKRSKITNKK